MPLLGIFPIVVGLAALLVLTGITYLCGLSLQRRWKYRHLPTPTLKYKWNFFPIMQEIERVREEGGDVHTLLQEWARECGSLYVIFVWTGPVIICTEPTVIRELLVSNKSSKSPEQYKGMHAVFGQRFLGSGLLSELDNESWRQKRKMMDPAFKRGYLKGLMYQYNNSAAELIAHLKLQADGKTEILMAHQLNKVALDIIAKVAFGMNDLNCIADDNAPSCKAISTSLEGYSYQKLMPFWRFDFRGEKRALRKATVEFIKFVRDTAKNCILERMRDIRAGNDFPDDILTLILQMSTNLDIDQQASGLEEMIDEFVTFFFAGQETTSQLMAFTFELAGRHPEVHKKMQDEVDRVIGDKATISYDDLGQLEYIGLVFKEVLRYTPPVAGVERHSDEEIFANGYKIPAGSSIVLSHYAAGRDERFWDDPEQFNPERFREESTRRLYAYFPFSLGSRNCIGQHFALIEAKVIVAKLLQTFDFRLKPGVRLDYVLNLTLKPKHRTPLYLTLRESSE